MRFSTNLRRVIVLGATLLLGASGTHAADQLILGKKLVIKNPPAGTAVNKVVHLGKDPAITLGAAGSAGDPQCTGADGGGTSSLRLTLSGGAGDVIIPLACGGWTTNAANTQYKYTDSTAATCKVVLVKAGVLVKAVCKGPQVAVDLNGTISPVAVVTTLNSQAYCTEFGGTVKHDGSDDKTFLRKDAAAPASCAPLTCPSGQASCGGTCVDLQNDPTNCGTCGVACAGGESCVSGTCCTSCGGTCVDLQNDLNNCGTCGVACAGGEFCISGVCD